MSHLIELKQSKSMSKFLVLFVGLLCLTQQAIAQTDYSKIYSEADFKMIQSYEDSIDVLSGLMLHDTSASSRYVSCKYMIKHLVRALKVKNSFQYSFPQFERLSIQYPEDSSFRIFTWQLFVDSDDYRYFGAIQLNNGDLKLIPLSDRSQAIPNPAKTLTTNSDWYGAIYYNIKTVESTAHGKYYLLFGYDSNNFFTHRKIIEAMQIKDGKAYFGMPVFQIPPDILEEKKKIAEFNANVPVGNRVKVTDAEMLANKGAPEVLNRFMITYSAEASAVLNYDEEYGMILFDNLISTGGNYKNQGQMKVPDGSYRGFKLQTDGTWIQVEKVFNDFQETAPRPVPLNRKNRLGGGK